MEPITTSTELLLREAIDQARGAEDDAERRMACCSWPTIPAKGAPLGLGPLHRAVGEEPTGCVQLGEDLGVSLLAGGVAITLHHPQVQLACSSRMSPLPSSSAIEL